MSSEDANEGCDTRRRTHLAGMGAVLVALAAVAGAAVVVGGIEVGSVPSAVASTTDATPWMPRPNTLPRFFPDMDSSVASQGTVRLPQESNPVLAWAGKVTDSGQDIQAAVQKLEAAVGAGDIAGAKAACEQMGNANQRLSARLPAPVPALTSEVQAIVDEIGAAYSVCSKAGPNAGQAEIDAFRSDVNAAMAHYERARAIGAEAAGPRPRPGLPN
jgi:hypothetical protein